MLFEVAWDSSSMADDAKHKLITRLPGLKNNLGNFESEDKAFERAEFALNVWMEGTGMQFKGVPNE